MSLTDCSAPPHTHTHTHTEFPCTEGRTLGSCHFSQSLPLPSENHSLLSLSQEDRFSDSLTHTWTTIWQGKPSTNGHSPEIWHSSCRADFAYTGTGNFEILIPSSVKSHNRRNLWQNATPKQRDNHRGRCLKLHPVLRLAG